MISYYYHPDYEKPDAEKQSCFDCRHCQTPGVGSWWCMSERAREYHGTLIPVPRMCKCPLWEPILPAKRKHAFFKMGKGTIVAPGDNWVLKIGKRQT